MNTYTLIVPTVTCGACTNTIQTRLSKLKHCKVISTLVSTNPTQGGIIKININEKQLTIEEVYKLIEEVGHEVSRHYSEEEDVTTSPHSSNRINSHILKATLTGVLGLTFMGLSIAGLSIPFTWMMVMGVISTGLSVYAGFEVFKKGLMAVWNAGQVNTDTLFTLSIAVALVSSLLAIPFPMIGAHFEAALMLLASRHIGKGIELSIQSHINANLNHQARLADYYTKHSMVNGMPQNKPVARAALNPGDVIILHPGEYLPLNGELVSDKALLYDTIRSGSLEARVFAKKAPLLAGFQASTKSLMVKITATEEQSLLHKLDKELQKEDTIASKDNQSDMLEHIVRYFVPGLLVVATGTFLMAWPIWGAMTALQASISVMVGACPCTLGFIIPMAQRVSKAFCARNGTLIKHPKAINAAKHLKNIVFDLNGTLTQGVPVVSEYKKFDRSMTDNQLYQIMAAIEKNALNSKGRAIYQFANQHLTGDISLIANNMTSSEQPGIQATLNDSTDDTYAIGNANLMASLGITISSAKPNMHYITKNKQVIAEFKIEDPLKKDAKQTISKLQLQGFNIILCTGADKNSADYYGALLNIQTIIANCEGSQGKITALSRYEPFAMVGDALNDAVVISKASIGIATHNADELTHSEASVTISHEALSPLVSFFEIAQKTNQVIRQNLTISAIYNCVVLVSSGLAASLFGGLAPAVMALGMAIQSMIVLANTYRLHHMTLKSSSSTVSKGPEYLIENESTQPSNCHKLFKGVTLAPTKDTEQGSSPISPQTF